MAFKDKMKSFVGKIMADPYNAPNMDTVATMATGERRGYRPVAAPKPGRRQDRSAAYETQPQQPVEAAAQTGMNTGYQQTGYQQTGFQNTGMQQPVMQQSSMQPVYPPQQPFNDGVDQRKVAQGGLGSLMGMIFGTSKLKKEPEQPATWQQPPYQQKFNTGRQMPMDTGYQQQFATGYQQPQPMNTGYQQQFATGYQQPQPMNTGYQAQPQMNTGYQRPANTGWTQPQMNTGYQRPAGNGWQQPGNAQTGAQEQPKRQAYRSGNVSYMDGSNFVDEDGVAYRGVIRVAQPQSTATCYRLIEFMRNDESVLVNTEMIKDPAELTRCLDLLFGAAFAMHCCYTRVASRSLYLISPGNVKVVPYVTLNEMHLRDNARTWPGSERNNPYDHTWQQSAGGSGRQQNGYAPERRRYGNPNRY